MTHEDHAEVLVVGAGPVGLTTALLLAEFGIRVKIIDQGKRTAAHSYACALHPRTLRLLAEVGLISEVLNRGHRVHSLGFFDTGSQRAAIRISELPGDHPFVVVLPQSDLEHLIEEKLQSRHNIPIHWNHRLAGLKQNGDSVTASVDKLGVTSTGYIIRDLEEAVEKSFSIKAGFVVGADGHNSHVRNSLGIECARYGGLEKFAVFEFETGQPVCDQARIVLDERTSNVLWPVSGCKYRWSFQISDGDPTVDFPAKDRVNVRIEEADDERNSRHVLQRFMEQRARWFRAEIGEIKWSTSVQFEHRLAGRFGQGRCWLVGDAAHQTGPIGMQSMNVGIAEADTLATRITKVLRKKVPLESLESYDKDWREEWQRLLALDGKPTVHPQADAWVRQRSEKILPCIPASGGELRLLARQLGLIVE